MRTVAAAVLAALSIVLFGFGFLSPLTPSEECPSPISALVFALLPALLPLAGARIVRDSISRRALTSQGIVIGGVAIIWFQWLGCLLPS